MSVGAGRTSTAERSLHAGFERFWQSPSGWRRGSAVNHSVVGIRFIVTGFAFFLLGGLLALAMRTQLAFPGLLDYQTYNQFFTMHGTTMMFLFAVPIMEGFGIYLIPKMIGARDLVFPRLGAFGYWCYLFGGLLLYAGLLLGLAPDGGWFMYVPLTGPEYSPGINADFWLLGVTFVEISSVTAAAELIVAILKTRAPGMGIHRMPLFAWYILVVAFMIVFGFPPLILGSILLELERAFGLPFFDPALGGDPLLWQHLFWIFGHPEVYIIFLPAAGVVSMVVPTFSQRPISAYSLVVLAAVATGFLSFGLWVHHMFAVGIPRLSLSFFSAASMAVAVPSGIQVFAWLATLWGGRPWLKVPLLFVLGFLFIFVLGGLTGVMVASVPFNWQVHDTYFVVAHLHYVLIGGMVFPLFAGLYYWLPLASGRLLSEALGKLAFWLMFIGFNVAFLPMHLTGLIGMPRRVYTYEDLPGWFELNLASTAGAYILAAGVAVFVVDVVRHVFRARPAGENPWRAGTLEWSLRLPVPSYNFISIPHIEGRDPLWRQPGLGQEIAAGRHYLADPDHGRRETMGTGILDGRPEQIIQLPHPTWTPLLAALPIGVFFVGFLTKQYLAAGAGAALALLALLAWGWQNGDRRLPDRLDAGGGLRLPHQHASPQAPGWWGTVIAILIDATLFASLLFGYYFLWTVSERWPPDGFGLPGWGLPALALIGLLLGSAGLLAARAGQRRGRSARLNAGLLIALAAGAAYLALQGWWLSGLHFAPTAHAYAALIYTIVGFHALHLGIALLLVLFALARIRFGYVTPARGLEVRIAGLFWHYVALQWLFGFATVNLFPLAI